jgi:hypothetical protein
LQRKITCRQAGRPGATISRGAAPRPSALKKVLEVVDDELYQYDHKERDPSPADE